MVRAAAVRSVERRGDRPAFGEQPAGPFAQLHVLMVSVQAQPRLATARGDPLLVASDGCDLPRRIRRALALQTMEKEYIEEPHRFRVDADRAERIEVHGADLDVLHATLA